jgi:hypothetical protein
MQRTNEQKGSKVKPTEHTVNAASTSKTGLFAVLRGLLRGSGSGAGFSKGGGGFVVGLMCFFTFGLASSVFAAAPALAETGFGLAASFAPAAGFSGPVGLAVDNSGSLDKGDVYVVNQGAGKVDEFTAAGVFVTEAEVGAQPNQLVVDDYPSLSDEGDVFVAGYGSGVVFRFKPGLTGREEVVTGLSGPTGVAVDAAGDFFVSSAGEGTVLEYNEKWEPVNAKGEKLTGTETNKVVEGLNGPQTLAVDAAGDIYAATAAGTIEFALVSGKYEAGVTIEGEGAHGVTVAPSKNVFVNLGGEVREYQAPGVAHPEGVLLHEKIGAGVLSGGAYGVGVSTTGTVYIADNANNLAYLFEEGPTPEKPVTGAAVLANHVEATLHGELKPAGTKLKFHFAYNTNGTCTGGSTTPEAEGEDEVSAAIAGLAPNTHYTYCLVAVNGYGSTQGGEAIFETTAELPTIALGSESTMNVTATSAELGAEIDPGGGATTYHFEYGTGSVSENRTAESGSIGSDLTDHSASAAIEHLQAGKTYHYRVVATNSSALTGVPGPEATFTTQPTSGEEFKLADDRGWEQVSPVDKHGASIEGLTKEGAAIAAATDGSAMTYVALAPVVSDPEGNTSLNYSQVMSVRAKDGGWTSRDLAKPHPSEPTGVRTGERDEYYAFTPDLTSGLLEPLTPATAALVHEPDNLFIRENLREPAGAQYAPLGTGTYVGASSNLEHVIFNSGEQLDELSNGTLATINILPNEEFTNKGGAGNHDESVRNAVSENGERVFWGAPAPGGKSLYMRDVPQEHTVQIDLPQGLSEPPTGFPEALFQYATPNGERVYFKDTQRLTANSTAELGNSAGPTPELYEYNTVSGELTDLTPNPEGPVLGPGHESSDVQGNVIGASNNGEYVYFVAKGKLAGRNREGHEPLEEPATPNNPGEELTNLYVIHITGAVHTTTFVTVLSNSQDKHDWEQGEGEPTERELQAVTSRMAPDGGYVAFMSDLRLTGYDNVDAVGNVPDEEVYEYSAAAQRLVCASCNPTGERPHGIHDPSAFEKSEEGIGLLVDRPEIWARRWLAASIPGWTVREGSHLSDYQSRYLNNEGRLFFDAADALAPADTNGKEDVYEYEPAGLGSCSASTSSGSSVYVSGAAGCDSLISAGTSSKESAFLDASESGEDVFFLTSQPLVSTDLDQSDDVYDAHVCTGELPCPSAVATPPPCTSADSCKAALSPQPAIFGASGSATFSGAGNPAANTTKPKAKAKPVRCKRGFVKKKGKCVREKAVKRARKSDRKGGK